MDKKRKGKKILDVLLETYKKPTSLSSSSSSASMNEEDTPAEQSTRNKRRTRRKVPPVSIKHAVTPAMRQNKSSVRAMISKKKTQSSHNARRTPITTVSVIPPPLSMSKTLVKMGR
jgi:hypothetical protein